MHGATVKFIEVQHMKFKGITPLDYLVIGVFSRKLDDYSALAIGFTFRCGCTLL